MDLKESWKDHEPAPLEFFHGLLMDSFHELRKQRGDNEDKTIAMSGIDMSNLIAKCKIATYTKYPNQVSSNAILKSEV